MTNTTKQMVKVVTTNSFTAEKTVHEVVKHTQEWREILCISIPQQMTASAGRKGTNRHFEPSDLESYLTEEAYKVLQGYDEKKNPLFDAHLRGCLARKIYTFFTDKEVDQATDYYAQKDTNNENGDAVVFEPNNKIDIWEETDAVLNFQNLLETLSNVERLIIQYTLKGLSVAEISVKMNVSRMTTHRQLKKLQEIPYLKEAILELAEAKGQNNSAEFEIVSTEEKYYSDKRVNKRKRLKVNESVRSTTSQETFQTVKEYRSLVKELNDNNRDLFDTVVAWKRGL